MSLIKTLFLCLLISMTLSYSLGVVPLMAENLTDKKALLIGNYKYKKKAYRLKTPKRDIKELKKILKKSGFKVSVHYNLNADELDQVVSDFGDSLHEDSIGYIHYAGHGIELNKESLILGVNFSALSSQRAKRQGFPVDSLLEAAHKATLGVVVIDACRDNPFYKKSKRSTSRGLAVGQNVKEPESMMRDRGVILIYSTAEGKTADEGRQVSPFIESMQKAYQLYAESPIERFFNYGVQKQLSKLSDGAQRIEMRTYGAIPLFSFAGQVQYKTKTTKRAKHVLNKKNHDEWSKDIDEEDESENEDAEYEAQLASMRLDIQRTKKHQSKLNQEWLTIKKVAAHNTRKGIRQINSFLQRYLNHPLGNPKALDAHSLLKELNQKKAMEKREKLAALHLKKVSQDWKRISKRVQKGNKKSEKLLRKFLKKYSKHELGNPLADEAQQVFDRAHQRYLEKHRQKVQKYWSDTLEIVKEDQKRGMKAIQLFLKQFAKHKLGNPLEHEAKTLLARLKKGQNINFTQNTSLNDVVIPLGQKPHVLFETNLGSFIVELEPKKAPITVKNFLLYVDRGFYTNLTFHRVIGNFMVQGGGFDVNMQKKKGRAPIVLESKNGLSNVRGSIAMARTSAPNSASSQFFINVVNNKNLDSLGGGYAVFGAVVKGMDVIDKIRAVPTKRVGRYRDVPSNPVIIMSAKRL